MGVTWRTIARKTRAVLENNFFRNFIQTLYQLLKKEDYIIIEFGFQLLESQCKRKDLAFHPKRRFE